MCVNFVSVSKGFGPVNNMKIAEPTRSGLDELRTKERALRAFEQKGWINFGQNKGNGRNFRPRHLKQDLGAY